MQLIKYAAVDYVCCSDVTMAQKRVSACCGQVEVPSSVGDHSAAQFLVRGTSASWRACMLVSMHRLTPVI